MLALSEGLRAAAQEELLRRLPRLLFAAVDSFPLSDGQADRRVAVVAVRSIPAVERLDGNVNFMLEELARGTHRPPRQLEARQLRIEVSSPKDESSVELTVNWHDCTDLSRQLQKAAPSCVEALALPLGQPAIIYATPEWWELRTAVSKALDSQHLLADTKPYMKACAGAALSLLHQREGKKAKQNVDRGAGYTPNSLSDTSMAIIAKLAGRVVHSWSLTSPDGSAAKTAKDELEKLVSQADPSTAVWRPLLQKLMTAADDSPSPSAGLQDCLDRSCAKLRAADYEAFRQSLRSSALANDPLQGWRQRLVAEGYGAARDTALPIEAAEKEAAENQEALTQVESMVPEGSGVVFLCQSGSFMYDLQVASSDMDFTLVYQAPPEDLLGLTPPKEEFSRHVQQGFGSDKQGVIEYAGRELGSFVALLAKGNPKNVEVLFSRKPSHRSAEWEELVAARGCFLTLRCAKQYLGFISERLFRAKELLETGACPGTAADDEAPLDPEKAGQLSKLLYHAHHKMLDLTRILEGGSPHVALAGSERQKVMQLRLQRPRTVAEGRGILAEAEALRAALSDNLKAAEAARTLPPEIDAQALISWLRSVRERAAGAKSREEAGASAGTASNPTSRTQSASSSLFKTRSVDAQAAIRELIAEIESSEKIRIVIAGLGISSRTMGTAHGNSDYDIKCIFVQPRSSYFGLKPSATTFKHHFAAAAGGLDVEISGWEARHALQLLSEDNPTVLGLLLSPAIYVGEEWRHRFREAARKSSNRQRLMHHWYNHARRNYQSYILSNDAPLRKRYVHVLRPLLSITWQLKWEKAWSLAYNRHDSEFPPACMAELLEQAASWGAVSTEEAETVRSLIGRPEELPEALPRVPRLDALLARLLDSERPEGAKPTTSATSCDAWHSLCVELINAEAPW